MLVEERIDQVLRGQIGSGYEWNSETTLMDERPEGLALDSLDIVEFVMRLEEEFLVPIKDDECEGIKTIADVALMIQTKLDAKA